MERRGLAGSSGAVVIVDSLPVVSEVERRFSVVAAERSRSVTDWRSRRVVRRVVSPSALVWTVMTVVSRRVSRTMRVTVWRRVSAEVPVCVLCMTDLLLLQLVKDRAATAMRAVVNLLYGIAQMFYFVFQFPDFMSQGISYIFPELVDIHLGEIHVFLPVVGTKALDLLPVAASVEEPAATGDESEQGGNEVPKVVHISVNLDILLCA